MWNEISCTKLQLPPEPLTRGLPPPDLLLSVLCPQLNLLNPIPNKIPGYVTVSNCPLYGQWTFLLVETVITSLHSYIFKKMFREFFQHTFPEFIAFRKKFSPIFLSHWWCTIPQKITSCNEIVSLLTDQHLLFWVFMWSCKYNYASSVK